MVFLYKIAGNFTQKRGIMGLSMITATDNNRLIGKNNTLPWHLPADLAHFKKITLHKTVLMGRKTFDSIGKPLPDRRNLIVSRNPNFKAAGIEVFADIDTALAAADDENEVMIIGGASFYEQLLGQTDTIYITKIAGEFEGDAYFPKFEDDFAITSKEHHKKDDKNHYDYDFLIYKRKI